MLRLLPFFLIWLTFSAHAVVDGQDIILASGAEQKLIREHSVRLYYKVNGQDLTFCSGVVLDPQTIATAGHCFAAGDDEGFQNAVDHGQIFAQLSTNDPRHRTRDVQIDVRGHEFSNKRDIAIVRVHGQLPTRESIPLSYSGCDANSPYYASGFGITATGNPADVVGVATYRRTRSAKLNVAVTPTDYARLTPSAGRICLGDSGGPVFCKVNGRLALFGIISQFEHTQILPIPPKGQAITKPCRGGFSLLADRVQSSMPQIEAWRAKDQSPMLPELASDAIK